MKIFPTIKMRIKKLNKILKLLLEKKIPKKEIQHPNFKVTFLKKKFMESRLIIKNKSRALNI